MGEVSHIEAKRLERDVERLERYEATMARYFAVMARMRRAAFDAHRDAGFTEEQALTIIRDITEV